jgi:predicted small lipoprotein YifL
MRRLSALLPVFAALVILAGCGSDGPPNAGPASVVGTYTLRTINGSPLPYTVVQFDDNKVEVMAYALTLEAGGTWTESGTVRVTEGGTVTTLPSANTGTYTLTGNVISLVGPEARTVSGTVDGVTLRLTEEGFLTVYTK